MNLDTVTTVDVTALIDFLFCHCGSECLIFSNVFLKYKILRRVQMGHSGLYIYYAVVHTSNLLCVIQSYALWFSWETHLAIPTLKQIMSDIIPKMQETP